MLAVLTCGLNSRFVFRSGASAVMVKRFRLPPNLQARSPAELVLAATRTPGGLLS